MAKSKKKLPPWLEKKGADGKEEEMPDAKKRGGKADAKKKPAKKRAKKKK